MEYPEHAAQVGAEAIASALRDYYDARYVESNLSALRTERFLRAQLDFDALEAQIHDVLGRSFTASANYDSAARAFADALRIWTTVTPPDALGWAATLRHRAQLYCALARYTEAEADCTRALELLSAAGLSGSAAEGNVLRTQAWITHECGRLADAAALARRAIALLDIATQPVPHAIALLDLCWILCDETGYRVEAGDVLSRAEALLREHVRADHALMGRLLCAQARLHSADGHYAEARVALEQALKIIKPILPAAHPEIAHVLDHLGDAALGLGHNHQALTYYREAERLLIETLGKQHPNTALVSLDIAWVEREREHLDDAETACRQALAVFERSVGPLHPYTAGALVVLASVNSGRQRWPEAESLLREAQRRRAAAGDTDSLPVAEVLHNLGWVCGQQGRHAEAVEHTAHALAIRERSLGLDHPVVASTVNNLACEYGECGELDKAIVLLWRSLHVRERAFGERHPHVALALDNLSAAYTVKGNLPMALALAERAFAIADQIAFADDLDLQIIRQRVAALRAGTRDIAGGIAVWELILNDCLEHRDARLAMAAMSAAANIAVALGLQRNTETGRDYFATALSLACRFGKPSSKTDVELFDQMVEIYGSESEVPSTISADQPPNGHLEPGMSLN